MIFNLPYIPKKYYLSSNKAIERLDINISEVGMKLERYIAVLLFFLMLTLNSNTFTVVHLNLNKEVVVRVYYSAHILAPDISFIKKIAEKWNDKYSVVKGFKVKIIDIDRELMLFYLLRSRNPNVDIVLVTNFNVGKLHEYLLPIDSWFNLTDMYLVALNSVKVNESIYAIPFHAVFPILIYRKDIIKKVPSTWRGIFALIDKLRLQNLSFPYGIAIYSLEGRHGGVVWQSIVESIVGHDINLSSIVNNSSIALSIYKECIRRNYCDPYMFYYEFFKLNDIYKNGKILMMIQWSYAIKYLLEDMGGEYLGIAPIPVLKTNSSPISRLYVAALAVSKFSAHKKEAIEFISYMIKNEINTVLDYGGLPPFRTIVTTSFDAEIAHALHLIMEKHAKPVLNSPMSSHLYEALSKYVKWFLINKNS